MTTHMEPARMETARDERPAPRGRGGSPPRPALWGGGEFPAFKIVFVFGLNFFLVKNFWVKIFLDKNFFLGRKFLDKILWSENFLGEIFF